MNKDVAYYMNLPYETTIRPLLPEEGGGWIAFIPLLGEKTFVATGETAQEAMESLRELKEILFADFIRDKNNLPEPYFLFPYNPPTR